MTGHGTEQKALAAHDKYGLNKFEVPLPPFGELLKEHLMAPFFVFQVCSVWCTSCQIYDIPVNVRLCMIFISTSHSLAGLLRGALDVGQLLVLLFVHSFHARVL